VEPNFMAFDYWVMLGVALMLLPFAVLGRDITRAVGVVFVAAYAVYAGVLVA
jgi:cation:H+ antiporter